MDKSDSAAKGRIGPVVIRWIAIISLVAAALLVSVLLARRNYLLFHSLSELFSVVVGAGVFVVAWNTRRFIDSGYLVVLGVAYLFISAVDLLHTLAYPGMGVFSGYGTNLAVQLWIVARYLEGLSFVAAFVFLKRRANLKLLLFVYASVFCLALFSIFYLDVFPVCFDAAGLTLFKRASEFVIIGILGVAMVLLRRNRAHLDRRVLRWIGLSIAATMASEVMFTLYKADLYGSFNMLGHYLKIVSFYMIYKALIETGLRDPYNVLFMDLKLRTQERRQAHDELEQRVRKRTADLTRTVGELEDQVRDRIRAEKELRQSQARLAEAQRIAHMGNWEWDNVEDKLWWSDEVFRIFGLSPQQFEATYEAFLECIHPDDREAVDQAVGEALHERGSYAIDHRIIRPDGTERIVHEEGEVTYDTGGKAVRMAGTVQDITERKSAEDAIKEERKRLFSLLNVLPGYVALKSGDGTIRYANHRFIELFGAPAGRPCYTVQFGRTNPCRDCPVPDVLKDNQPRDSEWTAPTGRSYHTWFYPFSDIDGTAVVLELGIDVTDRKELQKQVIETSEAVRRDIGRDLHDTLGQNLTGLALLIKGLSRKLAEHLGEELPATKQIVELVNDSVAQVRSLARGLDPVGLHGDGVVAGLRDLAGSIEEVFGVSCRFRSDKPVSLDDSVATHLYYIAQEAVNNAAKHARARNIDITLTGDGEGITLAVRDDGVGMDQRAGEVKGMGMRIMRYRAGVIGGSLSVESRTGGGTVVRCFLPKDRIAGKGSKARE